MKIRILQHEAVPENTNLFVYDSTGDYGPFDLIQCYQATDPTTPYTAFQAQFIKFGSIAYREKEYVELLSSLGIVDLKPETLQEMLTNDPTVIVVEKPDTETSSVKTENAPETPTDTSLTTTTTPLSPTPEVTPQNTEPTQTSTTTPNNIIEDILEIQPDAPTTETITDTVYATELSTTTAETSSSTNPSL